MINVTDRVAEGIQAVSPISAQQRVSQSSSPEVDASGKSRQRQDAGFQDRIHLADSNISYSAAEARHDRLNSIATTIRQADQVMSDVGQLIKERRFEIQEYEKQYPPLQNESSEKVEFLNSLTSLKKQIDALTLLPDFKEVAQIVGDPAEQEGGTYPAFQSSPIRQHEVHSGPSGLNIASINRDASDSEIRQFSQDLANADHKLERRKQGLATDAKLLADELSVGEKMLQTEKEAESKSQEIQQQLAGMGDQNHLSGAGSSLLERLS